MAARRRPSRWLVLAVACSILAAGCVSRVVIGERPKIDLLESLRLAQSTQKDVLAVLGEPSGKGRAIMPMDPQVRTLTMWTYRYADGPPSDPRGLTLFVYFDGDRYGGYMWFSSLPK